MAAAAAAANSNTTVAELAPMFRYALAPAAFTKTALPDLLAINVASRNTSLVAGQADRGIKELIIRLSALPKMARDALQRLGVDQEK